MTIRNAMVLAAGLGTRMRPLTLDRPKPLIEVGGRTLLDHALDRLDAAGVTDAVVNAHYLGPMIADHLAGRRRGPRTVVSHEDKLLETGGGVKHALPLLGPDPFFVVNADIVWLDGPLPTLARMERQWDPARMDALLLLMPTVWAVGYDGPGDFLLEPDGRASFREPGSLAPFVYAGVQIVRPESFADTPDGPFSNTLVWRRAAAAGRLYGVRHDGPWYHVGTPDAVAEVDAHIRKPAVRWAEP